MRHEADQAAARYGGELAIEHVVPTWHGARLRGVTVTLAEVPSVRVTLDEIEVSYGSGGRTVELRGGAVAAVGAREVILHQIDRWRSRYASTGAAGEAKSGGGGRTAFAGVRFSWKNDATTPTEAVSAADVRFSREDDVLSISAGEASAAFGRASVEIVNGKARLVRRAGQGYRVAELGADRVEAQLTVPSKVAAAPAPLVGRAALAGAPPPVKSAVLDGEAPAGPSGSLRKALATATHALDAILEPDAKVRLAGLHARVRHGDDSVNLGPGLLAVTRSSGHLVVELAPELHAPTPTRAGDVAAPPDEALTFKLSVPLSDAPEPIVADVQGGPISLSALGVKEGDFGLLDVARASLSTRSHVVLAAEGDSLRVDGEGKVHNLSLRSAALSDEPVAGLELAFRVKGDGRLDGSHLHIDAGEVDLGALRIVGEGDFDKQKDTFRVRGGFEVPLTACQSMLDSVPKGLVPKLQGMRMAGSFALKGKAAFDTAHLDHGFGLDWDISNSCRVTEAPPEINVQRFRKAFTRTAYDPQGRPEPVETGPGTAPWVSFGAISKFMEVAVLTTEDGGFHRHHGFDQEAIRNSIRENLRKKKFVRGASTISMQLAKNLYLDRGKNLSRKLQEAILTMYLEQELTKEQVLELYFNVVEFGPMIYGIGPAARYYFEASASELSLGQSLYISSIMPNPKVQHFGAGNAVSESWMSYLRKLMKLAHTRSRISDDELDEGLRETVVRGSPSPHRSSRPGRVDGDDENLEPPEGGEWLSP
ncbi:MAG: biosynthetic peptidoglycan transglycosylase [Byssovorax sp.]